MRKTLFWLVTILVSNLLINNLRATDIPVAIEGRIINIEPSKSITIKIKKSKSIELSLTDIKTLTIMDPKELSAGVGEVALISGSSGSISVLLGVVSPPKSLRRSKSKDVTLIGFTAAFIGAAAKVTYNFLTRKPPMLIYNVENEDLSVIALITNLPVGTKVRISQKNHINSMH